MVDSKGAAARLSVLSNAALVVLKLVVGTLIGSLSVVAEALHSGLDLVASVIAWISVRAADRPPDHRHPYGHGKFENVSGTVEAALIMAAALWIGYEAVRRLLNPHPVRVDALGLVVMGMSALVNTVVSRQLFRVARETRSVALEADAHHLSVDVYTSLGVLVGLVLIRWTGWELLDGMVALALAVGIALIAWRVTHHAAQPLLDTSLPPAQQEALIAAIREDPRVVDCHAVRTRSAGSVAYIDAHVTVVPGTTLEEADALEDEIRSRLQETCPRLDVLLHMEPAAAADAPDEAG